MSRVNIAARYNRIKGNMEFKHDNMTSHTEIRKCDKLFWWKRQRQ